jgi:hypothetical protein
MKPTRHLRRTLRPLQPLETIELASISGGRETASTSTSGTPAAGDDTIGDAPSSSIVFVGGWGSSMYQY